MDYEAWESCTDPDSMLVDLERLCDERKDRLLACAIIRQAPFARDGRTIWDLLPEYPWFESDYPDGGGPNCREAIEIIERTCDGTGAVGDEEWSTAAFTAASANTAAHHEFLWANDPRIWPRMVLRNVAARVFLLAITRGSEPERIRRAFSHRDPFRHPLYGIRWRDEIHPAHDEALCHLTRDLFGNPWGQPLVRHDWVTADVVGLATTAYEEHAFDLMPILGDALESAGCFDSEILRHCRHDRPHARGCWVVDQILKKESLPPLGA